MSVSLHHLLFFMIIVSISLRPCTGAGDDAPPVRLSHGGQVRGVKDESFSGKKFYSYMSIPYAEPPVGMLRFKDPVPVKPWKGILDSSQMPVQCLQAGLADVLLFEPRVRITISGKEDCLYINVYTKSPNEPEKKQTVMVLIHGGGFVWGGAQDYQPHVLMDTDIILVVFQYRLGIFGFLSTEDSVMPGNMGLKDQQLALKWVKENIAMFGGDPDTITIFGESGGAASVHYQILSPGSKGLFKRAIMQSGSALCQWASSADHRKFAIGTGSEFNCSINSGTENFMDCLQNVDAFYLILASIRFPVVGVGPLHVLPRVDGKFISKAPEILMKEGKYNKGNVMTGITKDDGALVFLTFLFNPKIPERINNNFAKYGPSSLLVQFEQNPAYLARKIYQFYLERENVTFQESDTYKILRMLTDSYFAEPYDVTAHLFLKSNTDVFLYQLDHAGSTSLLDLVPSFNRSNLVSHVDDLAYLFHVVPPYLLKPIEGEEDFAFRKIILSLWTNFAKSGNPNSKDHEFIWEKATENSFRHLSLTPNPVMKNDMFQEQRNFWSTLKTKRNLNLQRPKGKYPSKVEPE